MIAKDLITDEIPPLKPNESAQKAIDWMDEFKVSHLCVVDGRDYKGIISESDLLDLYTPEAQINDANLPLKNVFVYEHQHVFEVITILSRNDLTLIPVLNSKDKYMGCITIKHLMKVIADMSVVSEKGGVVVLELNVNDYSLGEVAQIVESNGAKILGSFITAHTDSTKMHLTFKVSKSDLRPILQTLNRYDYTVVASYDEGSMADDYKDRYDLFMKYLDI